MGNYKNILEGIESVLKAEAVNLAIPEENIAIGELGDEMPKMRPYLYIYALPASNPIFENARVISPKLTINIFLAVEANSRIEALDLNFITAGKILNKLINKVFTGVNMTGLIPLQDSNYYEFLDASSSHSEAGIFLETTTKMV